MVSQAAPTDVSLATPTREIARGVAWLAGTAIAVRLAEIVVGRSPLGAALAGAVIVDLAMTRAGVRWDNLDDAKSKRSSSRMWQGIGIGVAVASALVLVPLVVSIIVGAATIQPGTPSSSLVFGLLRGASVGVRDELLYRGLPLLVAARAGVRLPVAIGYAALAGTSALVFAGGLSWEALLLAASQGVLFAMLWARTNAAWAPVSAHAAWVFLTGVGLRGGIVEVSWESGMLTDGTRARGLPALLCVFVAVLLTAFVSKKLARTSEIPHGRA
ncbi:MAG: CPBP family intramembrane metalloprotease [Polyangiaceae bacterium]|nr:CPBP family intramembrane metalloprotease [Polyangiaceae bacterium]